ncbi:MULTISPECIES: M23 family metallopeptidase [Streptomyces]|uniref:M23 family metallopeptidase n=1 Tax=Streptomyces TaxID=1883 RepID=UPI002250F094|nr:MULTISPECIES: M23 family metallopeptidase [Streptomyces]MCX4436095.1 M23 family metallopeptidase [Streptomyces mirabilis]
MPRHDSAEAARALERFLLADPGQWSELAPRVVDAVGDRRLHEVVGATLAHVGDVRSVTDGPDGLVVQGTAGRTLAFAAADAGGRLTNLRLAPGPYRPPRLRVPAGARAAGGWALWCVLLAVRVAACWTASSVTGWCGDVLIVAAAYLLMEGRLTPARLPWWLRRAMEAGGPVALVSAWRLPSLPAGHLGTELVTGVVLLGGVAGYLVWARRHRWGAELSAPLRFPLRDGTWLIAQGGGPGLNHHTPHPEQRGAIDVIGVGARGARLRPGASPDAYLIYGAKLYAPCDGDVVSAADDYADQVPGTIRYEPPYGNHVFIDTGSELVKLAHLRPGTVTVTTGDRVRAGQLLGEVGNSGNTTEPHLHLHAERDGLGLDLRFTGITGSLHRGRTLRT